jgi:hypothetical protein
MLVRMHHRVGHRHDLFRRRHRFQPHFLWIRERCGAPRLAILPIGAYEMVWFMSPVHMDPGEAVKASPDLRRPVEYRHSPGQVPSGR